jgi:hypothetical protein
MTGWVKNKKIEPPARYFADEIDDGGNQRHRYRHCDERQTDDAGFEKTDEPVNESIHERPRRRAAGAIEQHDTGRGNAGAGDDGVDHPADEQHDSAEGAAGRAEI